MPSLEPSLVESYDESFLPNDAKSRPIVIESYYANSSSQSTESCSSTTVDDNAACIVGMACHLPGGIHSASELWDFLRNKQSAQCSVPAERFNIDGFYHPDGSRAGAINVQGGYFLQEDVRQFDNNFFGINNLEATHMDPQQRKILEVVYECFQNSGISMEEVSGSRTGVFIGNFTLDYTTIVSKDFDYMHRYATTGTGTSIMANRISHVFNLHGPSFTLDTACSSTIYALHQAVAAIKNGDCDGAIVAGVNLIQSPEITFGTTKGGFLSPTSACHTFDVSADGYGRAEGINAIYIKPLSSALKQGQKVRAVIRGTAVNANGRTPGIALPSATMQAEVIRKAYQNAGLDFNDTDYVECHGTGTPVGDPLEVEGLANCFPVRKGYPLMIGSVKTNLGHSEAASGLTSVIKVALAFEHDLIPPTYGVKNLNPKCESQYHRNQKLPVINIRGIVKLEARNFKVLNQPEKWPRELRRASINSFGYGGANGHVILESLDSYLQEFSIMPQESNLNYSNGNEQVFALPFSASSPKSLSRRRGQIQDMIRRPSKGGLEGLAFSTSTQEAKLELRDFALASTGLKSSILEIVDEDLVPLSAKTLPLAFVFTGQGAQYAGMGKELLSKSPLFLSRIRELDQILQSLPAEYAPTWSLEQTILEPPATSKVMDVTRSQPICTAVQIGLVDMLYSWGISPAAVVGHSSGEIAASYSAGILTGSQAILAAYFRGFTVGQLKSLGAMMAAGVSADVANTLIQDNGLTDVRVGCINSPESVTLSGSTSDIEFLENELQKADKFARRLQTGGRAYHSHMMAEIGDLYEQLLDPFLSKNASREASSVTMFSSVGSSPENTQVVNNETDMASYFRQNLEQPVQFNSALAQMLSTKNFHLIEVGPHSALKGPIQQIRTSLKLDQKSVPYTPTLVRKEDADLALKRTAGAIFKHGHHVNWLAVNNLSHFPATLAPDLPPYPWDYSKGLLWSEPRESIDKRNRKYLRHELLGAQKVVENGIDWNWRNILRLSEIPWLKDHKLESMIVLPGAAYVAMAIEAVSQIQDIKHDLAKGSAASFEFRNINISAPITILEDEAEAHSMEVHTSMSQRKISTANSSTLWYDFAISTWQSDHSTLHCTGSIRVLENDVAPKEGTVAATQIEGYERWSMGRWYEKTLEEGLNFGPAFRSLTSLLTDGNRKSTHSIATTQLTPPSAELSGTFYALHPITLDACFQAAIMGGTAGNLNTLRAYIPVSISRCLIQVPGSIGTEPRDDDCTIHSQVEKTGFTTCQVDCTLRQPNGVAVIDISGLRLSLYTGKAQVEPLTSVYQERHPTLRVNWKPDILRLHEAAQVQIRDYVENFAAQQSPDMNDNPSQVVLGALLDLAGHKNPRMSILELRAGCGCTAEKCLTLLDNKTAFPRYSCWDTAKLDDDGNLVFEDETQLTESFDALLIPQYSVADAIWKKPLEHVKSLLSDRAIVITRKSNESYSGLESAGFEVLELQYGTLLGVPRQKNTMLKTRPILILKPNDSSILDAFSAALANFLQDSLDAEALKVATLSEVDNIEVSKETICISTLELEREFFGTINQKDMDRLRKVTDVVTNLVWLTGANMMGSPCPDLTLSRGLARALMLEQPSLRFIVVDCGSSSLADISESQETCKNVLRALTSQHDTDDAEFIQVGNTLYISRFTPDLSLNSLFRRRLEETEPWKKIPVEDMGHAKLSIGQPGVMDTLHFQQVCEPRHTPPPGYVDVRVKAISLNAKDIYGMGGRVETKRATIAVDFAGFICAVGPGIDHLNIGDRVVGFNPSYFSTIERVPVTSVHKMLPSEEFTVMPTIMTIYVTALHALRDRAHLRAGETVLVHAGAGAVGIALITMAQSMGAIVYATCGSQAKREFLVKEMGVPEERIFNSRDASFVEGVKAATGHGVDVIVNSLVGDLMHESWDCIAPFGRFVEIGKKELIDAGKLDMAIFLRQTTFTAFDMSEYFFTDNPYYRAIYNNLFKEVVDLYRAGKVKVPPIKVYDAADVAEAYRYFNHKDRVGKVVVSLENPKSLVPVLPAKYTTVLDAEKSYLLVGCLGGLGRSLSRWMMTRGAKKFVFLGRSGCDKPAAARLVARLKDAGAEVTVVRGDVISVEHVQQAVSACVGLGPIGGVIQAAMGLHEALFTTMKNEWWHTGIQPKWKGTWNLHNALEGHDQALDFFLMTSSISGTLGTATESNYCSANGFLDAFAHWRRAQGKPAISLGLGMISEVGYLHENPEIEALLLRKGIQPLNEEELLQVIDFGLSGPGGEADFSCGKSLKGDDAHILTGLEPLSVRKLMAQGFDVSSGTTEDPRASILAASLMAEKDGRQAKQGPGIGKPTSAAEWTKNIPASDMAAFTSESDAPTMQDAIVRLVKKRFSSLVLMPVEQIDENRALPLFGVDSMIAAEFRTWFFNTFKVDVPYLDIVSPQKTLALLSVYVEEKLVERWN